MHRRVVVGLVALALVLAVALAGYAVWRSTDRSRYEQALGLMPAATLRATYTDWADVRQQLDADGLDAKTSEADVDRFIDRAYRADRISTSAVYAATYAMARRYGFSPLTAEWEALGQSRQGAVVAMRLPESADLGDIERNLRTLGYDAPADGPGTGGVWRGSVDLVAGIDPALTPVFENLVLLEEQRLVLLSDNADYAAAAADVAQGSAESLVASDDAVDELAGLAGDPVSAVLWASDFACEDLSMAAADAEDRALADRLVEQAGEVNPVSGLVMAQQPDHDLVVAMQFEDSDQAGENLRPRAQLASGDAVGQGGSFADRFRVATAKTSGANVVLHLDPVAEAADSSLLSDLSHGPVLFATC